MSAEWKELVRRCAKGRELCNCREAYLTPCATGYVDGEYRTDLMACQYGCSAAQLNARDEIAREILTAEMSLLAREGV